MSQITLRNLDQDQHKDPKDISKDSKDPKDIVKDPKESLDTPPFTIAHLDNFGHVEYYQEQTFTLQIPAHDFDATMRAFDISRLDKEKPVKINQLVLTYTEFVEAITTNNLITLVCGKDYVLNVLSGTIIVRIAIFTTLPQKPKSFSTIHRVGMNKKEVINYLLALDWNLLDPTKDIYIYSYHAYLVIPYKVDLNIMDILLKTLNGADTVSIAMYIKNTTKVDKSD